MSKAFPRGCTIFNCDRRHGNYCCADCGYKKTGFLCGMSVPPATAILPGQELQATATTAVRRWIGIKF